MSTTATSNTNEPQVPNIESPQTLSSFSLLPNDIVLTILARVPRRYHPILCCVSKNFRSLVSSSVLRVTRSLLGKDSFYVCFKESNAPSLIYHWFTLTEKGLVSIPFPSPREPYSAALMVGPEIYFIGGDNDHLSRSMWILDTQSGKLRQGPSMLVARRFVAAGLVDGNIYVSGWCDQEMEEIQVEVFDTNTRTWEVGLNPKVEVFETMKQTRILMSVVSPSLDRKIYVRSVGHVIVYDPRDGKCEKIEIPKKPCSQDVCMVDNVLYIYCIGVGLMWYNSKEKKWRAVNGISTGFWFPDYNLEVAIAEYNGKLAGLQQLSLKERKTIIWCVMIALDRNGVEITGKVAWFERLLSITNDYKIMHCLGRAD